MRDVLICAERMAQWTFKKKQELQVVIEFYRNMITADEAVRVMNERVSSGRRSGKIINTRLPFTCEESDLHGDAQASAISSCTKFVFSTNHRGVSSYTLGRKYGVSATTIGNIVKD